MLRPLKLFVGPQRRAELRRQGLRVAAIHHHDATHATMTCVPIDQDDDEQHLVRVSGCLPEEPTEAGRIAACIPLDPEPWRKL